MGLKVLRTVIQKMSNSRWWVWIGLFLLINFTVGCGSYSSLFWATSEKEEIQVLVPDGYEGRVLIVWQVPEGQIAEKEDNVWQYHLQEDGALLLQNHPPKEISRWAFWYEKADGTLEAIPSSTCFDSAEEKGMVVCTGMMAVGANEKEIRPNISFTITTLEDYLNRKWDGEEFFRLRDLYHEQLNVAEEE